MHGGVTGTAREGLPMSIRLHESGYSGPRSGYLLTLQIDCGRVGDGYGPGASPLLDYREDTATKA
jgi:hypothetical protein